MENHSAARRPCDQVHLTWSNGLDRRVVSARRRSCIHLEGFQIYAFAACAYYANRVFSRLQIEFRENNHSGEGGEVLEIQICSSLTHTVKVDFDTSLAGSLPRDVFDSCAIESQIGRASPVLRATRKGVGICAFKRLQRNPTSVVDNPFVSSSNDLSLRQWRCSQEHRNMPHLVWRKGYILERATGRKERNHNILANLFLKPGTQTGTVHVPV